jgi:hypothetical protein
VPLDTGAAIAARAVGLVGIPFRLRGRTAESGLDCVGVVAEALAGTGDAFDLPCDYTLRGEYLGRILAFFDRDCFRAIAREQPQPGDILLCRVADRQLHFGIVSLQGIVHAHAGLQRVVLTPLPLPWLIIGHWRYIGD